MGEPEKVKRTRTISRSTFRPVDGRRTERHELGLGRMDRQSVLAESLRHDIHDALGIALVAKPNDKIIRIADEIGVASQTGLHLLFEPQIQHVVQEHIRKHG